MHLKFLVSIIKPPPRPSAGKGRCARDGWWAARPPWGHQHDVGEGVVLAAAKRVRSETQIGANAVSLASATVSLARRMYSDFSTRTALMIGAGEMIALTARHFAAAGVKRILIANRTLANAQSLAAEIGGY